MIPTWNEANRLPRLLDAIAECRPPPLEVIVVDAGSDDGTRDAAAGRARVLASDRGRARQQNAGASAARGRVLWFLHADSKPRPEALGEIERAIDEGAAGGCFTIEFPEEEVERAASLAVIERGINLRTRLSRTGTGDQGIFVRREAFDAIGGFPDWPLLEDVGLFRALKRTGPIAICHGSLRTSARRWLNRGVVRTMLRMWALRIGFMAGVSPDRLARAWDQRPAP